MIIAWSLLQPFFLQYTRVTDRQTTTDDILSQQPNVALQRSAKKWVCSAVAACYKYTSIVWIYHQQRLLHDVRSNMLTFLGDHIGDHCISVSVFSNIDLCLWRTFYGDAKYTSAGLACVYVELVYNNAISRGWSTMGRRGRRPRSILLLRKFLHLSVLKTRATVMRTRWNAYYRS